MAHGIAEDPGRSPTAQLDGVEFPASKQMLVQTAADNGASVDVINLFKSLPREDYQPRQRAVGDLAEAAGRWGRGNGGDDGVFRDRRNIGRDAVENAPPGKVRHP